MEKILRLINKSFGTYEVRGLYMEPTYWQAAAIVVLLFLLVFTLARLRWLYVHWNLGKSSVSMIFWGFLLALLLEGLFIIGGRTMFSEILGWKDAPKPISTVLDITRNKIVGVMGVTDSIPESNAEEVSNYQSVVSDFENLSIEDKEVVRDFVCKP